MLRFIVLGDLPGTDVDLTFLQVVLLLGGMYVVVLRALNHRLARPHPARPEEISL